MFTLFHFICSSLVFAPGSANISDVDQSFWIVTLTETHQWPNGVHATNHVTESSNVNLFKIDFRLQMMSKFWLTEVKIVPQFFLACEYPNKNQPCVQMYY